VSVESPFRQHTQFNLEPEHKLNGAIPNRGEFVHRALTIIILRPLYWAPTGTKPAHCGF